ncbi:MAG: biotin--[acetyl-CoA-carboxylase] ligase [Cyanobacteria bacterium J06632_22]
MQLDALYQSLATYPLAVAPSLQGLRPQLEIHYFDRLASTNQTLWEMVRQGAGAGTVVVAQAQTAGRGQRGRRWISAAGGVYVSMLLEPDWDSSLAPLLTCTSGWGIATLLRHWDLPIEIKWPNDLVVRSPERADQLLKLGGILTETRTTGQTLTQAVVGVGLNYANVLPAANPQVLDRQPPAAIALQPLLDGISRSTAWSIELAIATVLLGIWQGLCWQQQVGTTHFLKAYKSLLAHLGQSIDIGNQTGHIIGVTAMGELQVSLPAAGVASPNRIQTISDEQLRSHPPMSPSPSPTGYPYRQHCREKIITLSTDQVSLSYNNAGLNHIV